MSEPASYALHVAVQPDALRDWLAAPCPPPETWRDWEDLDMLLSPDLFACATRASGRPIGELVAELVWDVPGGWHFAWAHGYLTLVALRGPETWAAHILFLCAFRTLGEFGAGPGAAVSHGYIWREGITDWALEFRASGQTLISSDLLAAAQAQLDEHVLPHVEAARAGEAGTARNELDFWRAH